jgi:hypothetical protein
MIGLVLMIFNATFTVITFIVDIPWVIVTSSSPGVIVALIV